MALSAMMAQLGPELQHFAGRYEFHPKPPPPLTEDSQLVVINRDTIQWSDTTKGASAVYVRSKKLPNQFVGDDGSNSSCCNSIYDNTGDVWVLDTPGAPLGFRSKKADPAAGPSVTAMLEDVPEQFQNRRVAGAAKVEQPQFGKLDAMTSKQHKMQQSEFERNQKREAEKMAVQEAITNDRNLQKANDRRAARAKAKQEVAL